MEWEDWSHSTVDPEVRAHINSLVSALGGTGADEDGRYVLGDEALACLKDLKKWLKLYDEKTDRLDVARCMAEANLVEGDLLPILALWSESANHDRLRSKVALACIELLVPLTWPIEKGDAQMTVNHHRHMNFLQQAQASYKRSILQHGSGQILRIAVRTGLPSIALSIGERSPRDEGIIKLILYFFRNITLISSQNAAKEDSETEITRSSTAEAFHRQDVLALLLTLSSNIGQDFTTQDTVLMEVLFHLLRGVDVEKLFMDSSQLSLKNSDELKTLLSREANMHRSYLKTAPTRHNRFGTMIWVKRDGEGRHSTVSGQDVLKSGQRTLTKMDQTKKWNKPKQRAKDDEPTNDRFDMPVPLTEAARVHMRSFVEEFLDSGFNPLFNHIRRAIEREADRVLESHKQQYFYLVSWFLEAERVRRRQKREANKRKKDDKIAQDFDPDSFGLISSVLIQEFFVLLNRFLQSALDLKLWRELQAGMRCFTQILLIVQDMADSPLEEDQEIAENIQNRIFYEESTHDRVIAILRGYKDQGLGYLDSSTDLAHTFLRLLERYSRENLEMQVRSKRRARKTRKAQVKEQGGSEDDDEASEIEDVREAERVSRERKFDFNRFSTKFMSQSCIDTFVSFTKFYSDLSPEQLKRAHRFFYRVAFKQDLSVMLFRVDIVGLFYKLMKGAECLDPKNPTFREWDELVRQIIKKLTRKLEKRPELAVELLFSKIQSTMFYLEYGYEKQTIQAKPKAPAALEVKGSMTLEEQIGVVVAALYDENMDSIQWVVSTLSSAADERRSWENESIARQSANQSQIEVHGHPPGDAISSQPPSIVVTASDEGTRIAMFKNARLRLLMVLSSFKRLGEEDEPDSTWIIPSPIPSSQLRHIHDLIEKHRQDPKFQYGEEEPVSAEDMLRRKSTTNTRRAEYDDDSDGSVSQGEEDFLFPAGGPTNTVESRESALDKLKKNRRKRRASDDHELDEETREARRNARAEADLERRRGIKSAQFVHESDEDTDEEKDRDFFAREAARRNGQRERVMEALSARRVAGNMTGGKAKPSVRVGEKRKFDSAVESTRKKAKTNSDASGSDEDLDMSDSDSQSGVRAAAVSSIVSSLSETTPLSSPPHVAPEGKALEAEVAEDLGPSSQSENVRKLSRLATNDSEEDKGDSDVAATIRRPRARAAIFDDSDDE
ncbi:uncharacterized protein KY384_005519 [Bacidia gigantensis]|uniref:uncharacterized protein n=1 Tax=Bacidia gigantensis TaxID=2732470 RepID=UPI001D03D851|nr:uncharacterized protein KY384_005519 [Bacidia gigantensis]KAG8530037.1 hypothetical protein KY384_005519 [Bacidia gigantensis]